MPDKSINSSQEQETPISYGFRWGYGFLSHTGCATDDPTPHYQVNNRFEDGINSQGSTETRVG